MTRKQKITIGISAAMAVAVFTATAAYALANINLTLGETSYDFGNGPEPATVQFHIFTVKPGEVIPWHSHKAVSYVVLERGSLTETHVDRGSCVSEEFQAGSAFVEQPGEVHSVVNKGNNVAVITWATAFPSADGIHQLGGPQFTLGGIYPPDDPPSCN